MWHCRTFQPLFFRTVRNWSEIIKTSSLPCPVVLWGVLRQQNIEAGGGGEGGLNKIIRNRGNISKYQHPTSVHRRWDRGSARKARGLSLQKHNTLSFSILHRRDRTVAIVKNFIAKIHVYSFWFSTEPNTEPACDKRRRRIRGSLILLRLQVSFLFFI